MADKVVSSPVAMATSGASAASPPTTPKKAVAAKPKKPHAKPTHPKTAEMVNSAIKALKERGGSSVQAIKKYIAGTYKIDAEKQATFIKKYLKAAVVSGVLIQAKGKGAAGSFKLLSTKPDAAKPKTKPIPRAAEPKKATASKKPVAPKKPTADAAKKAPKKKNAATAVSEKKKLKKMSKGPAAKPPKAKTAKAKPATKAPAKTKPITAKKAKPVVDKAATAKPKKAAPKKAPVSKK